MSQEFIEGAQDCIKGVPHKIGKSEEYNKGYAYQYEYDQKCSARCSNEQR